MSQIIAALGCYRIGPVLKKASFKKKKKETLIIALSDACT
jgi:hypothetical protein